MELLDSAGDELLLGLGGGQAVKGELAGGLGADFEKEVAAVAPIGVDGVDGAEPGGAVEVGGVGDAGEGYLHFTGGQALGYEGDIDRATYGDGGLRCVDEGRKAAVAEGVRVDLLFEERGWGW